jgi:hypothetical protein
VARQITKSLLVGAALFLLGLGLSNLLGRRSEVWIWLGVAIALGGGFGYPVFGIGVALKPVYHRMVRERERTRRYGARVRAQDELLKLKKLLDEGILSQAEYATQADELKRQILQGRDLRDDRRREV